ncbi:MAG TPA: carboxypeptidase-like regulatory domain-containing protein, partial [Prolixibacteraceae bacterium]|nr:carboxypeptidase-like regulatory domain-containing protein [Prolixibacteraceae bacterium]
MRLSLFFLLLMTAQGWALDTYSQVTRLSLALKDTRVIDVLQEIEQKSEFYFLFNQKLVDVERRVDLEVKNKPIEEVLSELFTGTNVNYLVMNRQIVLTTARTEAPGVPQQPAVLTGKVTDATGSPLPGVSVTIKGTVTGTITNPDGIFSLANVSPEATLVFSFVGMKTLEVVAGNRTTLTVVLEEELIGVDEVVVVGYGIQKKKLVTGATLQVKGENIEKLNASSVLGALQSQSPGVYITQSSGQVGEGYNINIRGLGTTGNSAPLYVIDGVAGGSLNSLNPSDIESIDILDVNAGSHGKY